MEEDLRWLTTPARRCIAMSGLTGLGVNRLHSHPRPGIERPLCGSVLVLCGCLINYFVFCERLKCDFLMGPKPLCTKHPAASLSGLG